MPVALALPEQVTDRQRRGQRDSEHRRGDRHAPFQVGVGLVGARPDRFYVLGTTAVDITLGGTVSQLNALDPAALCDVNVAALDAGVTPWRSISRRPAASKSSRSPAQIIVTVQEPSRHRSASP